MEAQRTEHTIPGGFWYEGILFPGYTTIETLKTLPTFHIRDGDVIIASFPKSGTTWLQEIVYLVCNHGDVDAANSLPSYKRVPLLEMDHPASGRSVVKLNDMSGTPHYTSSFAARRYIKTHLPPSLLPQAIWTRNTKIVFVTRNPKDMLVSLYHFYRMNKVYGNLTAPWDDFYEMFRMGKLAHGDWFDFTNEWLQKQGSPNLLIISYEEMKEDLQAAVEKIARAFDCQLDKDVIDRITHHTTFDAMSENPACNRRDVAAYDHGVAAFMRRGVTGDWHSYFSPQQRDQFDAQYKAKMNNNNLTFNNETA